MKKILPIFLVGVLIISGLGAVAISVEDNKHLKKSLSFSELTTQENMDYINLELNGANSVFMKKDYYMVPKNIQTFTFPIDTEIINIRCIPKNIHTQKITKELMVSPEPVAVNQLITHTKTNSNNPTYKTISKWYDYDIGMGIINDDERGLIVKVETYPIQYNPSNNEITWAETIDLDIEYIIEPQNPLIFNEDYQFIILASDEFESILSNLVQHKNDRGITTKFVSTDEIYSGTYFPVEGRDSPERIKYFIKNAMESWGTSYVLLVGGSAKFPTRMTHVHVDSDPPDDELFVTDLYFADIYNDTGGFSSWDTNENDVFGEYHWGPSRLTDDVDLYPDVFIGRIACTNTVELTTCVNKIITYEDNEAYTQGWFGDLIVFGGDSFPGDGSEVDEGELVNQAVIDVMDGFVPNKMWASEGDLSGIIPTGSAKMTNAINEGAGFIDFSGHGNTEVWATHPHEETTWLPTPFGAYRNIEVSDLSNGDELPIVVIGACSVSKYNMDTDCFGWSFVSNPDGGAIATLGATGLGWAYTGFGATQGLIEGMALKSFEAYRDGGALTFGEMWGKALNQYITTGMQDTDYKTIEEWQPLGDPTLQIGEESLAPNKPENLNGPTNGKILVEYSYTASTTDPDGDKVYYLFDWGDGEFSGWVGPYTSGATGQAKHTWTEQGDYEIRVKAKDDHGIQSEWSDPLPVTMPQSNEYTNPNLLQILKTILERFPNTFPILRQILGL